MCLFNHFLLMKITCNISTGVSIEQSDVQGNKPLHYASKYGSVDICKLLIDKGSSAAARNISKQTPYDVTENHVVRQFLLPLQLRCEREQEESLLAASGGSVSMAAAPPSHPYHLSGYGGPGVSLSSAALSSSSRVYPGTNNLQQYGGMANAVGSGINSCAPPAHLSTAPPSSTLLALAAEAAPITANDTPPATSGFSMGRNSNQSSSSGAGVIGNGMTPLSSSSSSGSMINMNLASNSEPPVSRSSSNDSQNSQIIPSRSSIGVEKIAYSVEKNPFAFVPQSAVGVNTATKVIKPTISNSSISFPDQPAPPAVKNTNNATTIPMTVNANSPHLPSPTAASTHPPPAATALSSSSVPPPSQYDQRQQHIMQPPPSFLAQQGSGVAQHRLGGAPSNAAVPARVIRPDGFHSSASDPVLQQRYGHIKEAINIAPPPIFSAPSAQQASSTIDSKPINSGGGQVQFSAFSGQMFPGGSTPPVYNRYPVYDAHTNSVYAPPPLAFSQPLLPNSSHFTTFSTQPAAPSVGAPPPAYRQYSAPQHKSSPSLANTPPHPSNINIIVSPTEDVTAIDASSSALM